MLDLDKLSDAEAAALDVEMQRNSLTYFAASNLSGPPEAPYSGRFLVGPHHYEWDALANVQRALVLAPRDHGKCPVAGALVLRADGRRIPVERWEGGEILALDVSTHQFVKAYAPPSRSNGKRRCVKVTTRTGRVETVSRNHEFRLWDRWILAEQLEEGQRIAVPRTIPVEGASKMAPGSAWLLGFLTGDGGLTTGTVHFTTADAFIVAEIQSIAAARKWSVSKVAEYGYSLHANYARAGDTPLAWARAHGIMGKGAYEKRVPESVFTSCTRDVAAFVAGLFDSDGHASVHGGGSLELYSVAELLLRDVQHLLCRLGIVAVLSPKLGKYNGEDHHSWRLTIRGSSIVRFAERVPVRGSRRSAVEQIAKIQSEKDEGGSVDLLPSEVCSLISKSEDWLRKRGSPRFSRAYDMTRSKARAIGEVTGDVALVALADAEVLWDEVVAIEDVGELETFAMSVPGHENYLENDIVTHNSVYWSMAFPIWKMAFGHRGDLGYIFSANQDRANELLQILVDELTTNPKLAWLLPARWQTRWSKRRIWSSTGVEVRARGFGVKVRGGHPKWVVNDDVLGDSTLWSETQRKKDTDYFFSAITNMVVPGGQIIVPGTPFHADDMYAKLKETKGSLKYVVWQKPALDPKTGKALWPARYNEKLLAAKRDEIGSVRFTREYGVNPISDDMSLFPSYLFEGEPIKQRAVRLGMPADYWNQLGITTRFMGVDIALSAETGADFFVCVTLGIDGAGNRWLCDIFYQRGLSFHGQLDKIHERARLLDPALIYIEDNAMQRVWGDELIRTSDLPIKKFTTSAQIKNSLEKGIFVLRPLFENKKHRLPVGDQQSEEKVQWLVSQFTQFAWVDGKLAGVGSHDDGVIAYWIADFAARRGASAFASFGEATTRQEIQKDGTVAKGGAAAETVVPPGRLSMGFGGLEGMSPEEKFKLQAQLQARAMADKDR